MQPQPAPLLSELEFEMFEAGFGAKLFCRPLADIRTNSTI